jgi:transposase-like protein
MKKQMQWCRHVKVWRESGLSQADYCRQQGLNAKTFSVWVRRVRDELPLVKDAPLEIIPIQVASSVPVASVQADMMLRFSHGEELKLSTAVSPRWLAELLQCLS